MSTSMKFITGKTFFLTKINKTFDLTNVRKKYDASIVKVHVWTKGLPHLSWYKISWHILHNSLTYYYLYSFHNLFYFECECLPRFKITFSTLTTATDWRYTVMCPLTKVSVLHIIGSVEYFQRWTKLCGKITLSMLRTNECEGRVTRSRCGFSANHSQLIVSALSVMKHYECNESHLFTCAFLFPRLLLHLYTSQIHTNNKQLQSTVCNFVFVMGLLQYTPRIVQNVRMGSTQMCTP